MKKLIIFLMLLIVSCGGVETKKENIPAFYIEVLEKEIKVCKKNGMDFIVVYNKYALWEYHVRCVADKKYKWEK